ncbi:hypothetical protein [Aneurinibacillus terranovensis]|uniref:hypothetical protein n=1 Tax=Aneurinibacillus terranovensis TaxID=278991 RepID=UPI0003F7A3A9|nr:hypothetical protein [Aneurinibacillus terranovensis]
MQYIFLQRVHDSAGTVKYVYHYDDHTLSPGNLVLRNLFFCMLDTVEDEVDEIEVEYNDVEMVKVMGLERAVAWLKKMGADTVKQTEKWEKGILLSRTFIVPATQERLEYLHTVKDLDEVYCLRLLGKGREKICNYFSTTLSLSIPGEKEAGFLSLLQKRNVPHKIL